MVWLRVLLNKLANTFFEKLSSFLVEDGSFFLNIGLKWAEFYSNVGVTTLDV